MKENMHEEPPEKDKQALFNLMRTLNALSYEELDAIGGESEMTEDMFKHCIYICIQTDNFSLFEDIWNDFPDFNAAVALKVYEVLNDSEILKAGEIKNKFLNTVLLRIDELCGEHRLKI